MLRHNLALEIIGLVLVLAGGFAVFFGVPVSWYIAAPLAIFASYVLLETVLPKVWETPPKGIRHEPGEDE